MPPAPLDHSPSPFVADAVAALALSQSARVLDLASGYGRHAIWLAGAGHQVDAVEIDEARIAEGRRLAGKLSRRIRWIAGDAEQSLPIAAAAYDLAIVVHYYGPRIISVARTALRPGGILLLETIKAQGGNWQHLPDLGSIPRKLGRGFDILSIVERAVGPDQDRAVVRAVARRRTTTTKTVSTPSP